MESENGSSRYRWAGGRKRAFGTIEGKRCGWLRPHLWGCNQWKTLIQSLHRRIYFGSKLWKWKPTLQQQTFDQEYQQPATFFDRPLFPSEEATYGRSWFSPSHFSLVPCLLPSFFFFVFPEVRRTIAEMRTATPQQDDYGAANGADLMDGTSEDVQPPCSLAIKSPSFSRACITLSISQSYIFFFFSTRGVMTTKWQSRWWSLLRDGLGLLMVSVLHCVW